jgi:hypothetical protein
VTAGDAGCLAVTDPETTAPPGDDDPAAEWADCPLTAQMIRAVIRGKRYYTVQVKTVAHEVKVYVSPRGRSVRVYLDGVPMSEEPPELTDRLRGLY